MWPASHSERSRTSRSCRPSASRRARASSHPQALDPPRRAACPGARPSSRRTGSRRSCAGRRRRRARSRARASSSSRPTTTMSLSRSAIQASREPKPACRIVIATEPRMWASSNCSAVRTSTISAPSSRALLDLARGQRHGLDRRRSSGPRLISHDRAGSSAAGAPAPAIARSTNRPSSSLLQQRRCAPPRTRRSRRSSCPSPGRRTASRPGGPATPRCPGAAPAAVWCSEWKMPRAPSCFSTARSGRAMSPTNSVSPVSTAHGSSPRAVSDRARTRCARAGGRACGSRARAASPSSSSQPSSNGSCS